MWSFSSAAPFSSSFSFASECAPAAISTTSENGLFSTNTRRLLLLLFHVFAVDEPALLQHISRRIVDVLESICVSLSPRIGYQDRVEYLPTTETPPRSHSSHPSYSTRAHSSEYYLQDGASDCQRPTPHHRHCPESTHRASHRRCDMRTCCVLRYTSRPHSIAHR